MVETVGIVQTVNEDISDKTVFDTISVYASREAGFDGVIVEGGKSKITTGSIGCPKVDRVKVGKSNSMSVKTGNESLFSIG